MIKKRVTLYLSDDAFKLLEEHVQIYELLRNQMIEECIKTYYLRNKILKEITNNYKEILEVNNKKE